MFRYVDAIESGIVIPFELVIYFKRRLPEKLLQEKSTIRNMGKNSFIIGFRLFNFSMEVVRPEY